MIIKKRKSVASFILFFVLSCSAQVQKTTKIDGKNVWKKARKQKIYALPSLWLLSIGISRYEMPLLSLSYADKDALAIEEVFKKQEGILYDRVNTKHLINEEATRSNILESFNFLNQAASDDIVIIFISGHGYKRKLTESYYFLPYEGTSRKLVSTGLLWASFEEGIKQLRQNVNKIVMLLDTCHAGAMKVNEKGNDVSGADLAAQLKPTEGLFVLASSKGGETSIEDSQYEHGVFTKAILNGLNNADYDKDETIMITELFQHVSKEVPIMTDGEQHPYQRTEGTDLPIAAVQYGFITIDSTPWGIAKINGEKIGETPIFKHPLYIGSYKLEIESKGNKTYEENILINHGENCRRSIILNEN